MSALGGTPPFGVCLLPKTKLHNRHEQEDTARALRFRAFAAVEVVLVVVVSGEIIVPVAEGSPLNRRP